MLQPASMAACYKERGEERRGDEREGEGRDKGIYIHTWTWIMWMDVRVGNMTTLRVTQPGRNRSATSIVSTDIYDLSM
jgi:hypothetical protein